MSAEATAAAPRSGSRTPESDEIFGGVRGVLHYARLVPLANPTPDSGSLRRWQTDALERMASWSSGSFLVSAAPGAGKTRPALEFARRELSRGGVDGLVVACPTAPLTRQWAHAAHGLGLELVPDAESPRPPAGFDGVVVTYARIARGPRRWGGAARARTLVIADEAHHLGDELAWGESFAAAFAPANRWLLLSGTPFRSDATAIPGVSYDSAGLAEPDFSYAYADAVADGVCRPVTFITYDGTLSWQTGDDVIESSFDTVLSTREASRRYRTAISSELPDGLPRILREADQRLRALRGGSHPDAGGLVIAADSGHARRLAARLREITGHAPVVVLHAEPRAATKLAEFTSSGAPWIVAVNMVSEGVDIPRLRVGVYATAAKTPLVFRQIVGRFVRTLPDRPVEPSWLYVPADPVLREHAATVDQEIRHVLRAGEGSEDDFERPERQRTERAEVPDFVPLSADVAPQMALFGPPPTRTSPVVARKPPPAAEPISTPTPIPAFERRRRLRSERHRLVSDVTRRERLSHGEVNAWVNRQVGIGSVEQATIEQLQRAVEFLERRLKPR